MFELRSYIVSIEMGNEVNRDLFGAGLLTLTMVGATAEVGLHGFHHRNHTLEPLRLALR